MNQEQSVSPVEKAAQLGTEHGAQAAEEWLTEDDGVGTIELISRPGGLQDTQGGYWPQPDSCENGSIFYFAKIDESGDYHHECVAAYSETFRSAVEATIRAKCEETAQ